MGCGAFDEWPQQEKGISLKEAQDKVGPGWSKLIEEIYDKIGDRNWELISARQPMIVVENVSNKYGWLDMTISLSDIKMKEFQTQIELRSMKICEICGKDGDFRYFNNQYWGKGIRAVVRCEICLVLTEQTRPDPEEYSEFLNLVQHEFELHPRDDRQWYPGKDAEDDAEDGIEPDLPF